MCIAFTNIFFKFKWHTAVHCGNYGNSFSRIFDKNFVKATVLLNKLLKSWFHEIFFRWERISEISTLCTTGTFKKQNKKKILTVSPSNSSMASKSALPTPTIIIDNGKEEASTIAYGKDNGHLMKRNFFFFFLRKKKITIEGEKYHFISSCSISLWKDKKSDKKV